MNDPSFETPTQTTSGYTYNPTGTSWTFAGSSGIEANGSAWGAVNAPDGVQAAFLQSSGSGQGANGQVSQTLNFTASGSYGLEFQAAQRQSNGNLTQSIGLYLDGTLVNTFTPTSANSWSTFGAAFNVATAGNHTIALQAVNSQGDETCFLDNLTISNYSPPTVATAAAASPNPVSGTTTSLSVLGASTFGGSSLTYTWSVVGTPPAPVSFSPNGTSAAQNATASFTQSGSYALQVTVADPLGGSVTSSVSVSADVGLGTPSNLSATWGGNAVNLTWSPAVGAQSYNVYRGSTSGGELATPLVTGVTSTNYVDNAAMVGQPYFYKVTAVSAASTESSPSPEAQARQASDGASYRYDIADGGGDTAANVNETLLNPLNVTAGNFSKQFTVNVDGQVLAQPLYMNGVDLTGGANPGVHNVVFVATEHDSVYAIDANGGQVLWQVSPLGTFNVPGTSNTVTVSTVPSGDVNSGDISPEIGITGTPVIDTATGYMYVVVKTKQVYSNDTADPHYVNTLYKINIADASVTSTVIADTTYTAGGGYIYNSGPYVLGDGDGAINVGGQSRVYFNSLRQMFRPAVVLSGGEVVLGSASHGDNTPYHGWMLTYDENSLALTGVLNASPNSGYSGIWQGDAPIVVDPQGYFYFETGNGPFNQNASNFPNGDTSKLPIDGNYGDSIVKVALDPTTSQSNQNVNGWGLKVVDYFTPEDQGALNSADEDLGSGGPIILPDSVGSAAHPHLLIAAGKEGKVYLIDRDHMGGFSPTDAGAVQTQGSAVGGVLSAAAYFNGTFYYTGGYSGGINAFSIANGAFSTSPTSSTPDGFGNLDGGPVITADGTVNGIVWALDRGTGQLRAYDASNLGHELYTSAQAANNADAPGSIMKYTTPMVVDGEVFVGTGNSLVVYGIPSPPTTPPNAPTTLTATSPVGSEVQLSWADNSNNESEFDIERSTDGSNWTQIAAVGVNVATYNDTTVQALTQYFYRVRARNSIGPSDYTNVASVNTTGVQSIGTGDGLLGAYYSGNSFNFSAQTPLLVRVDPTINFNWNTVGPDPVVGQSNYAVRWTGEVQAQYTEPYRFSTVSDDGIRVIFNGQTVIDDETYHGATVDTSPALNLVAGQSYSIEVDYFQGGGDAEAILDWSSPSTPQQAVPQSQLFSGSAPAAPTLLPPVAASGTQINLAWTESSTDATGFEIDRKVGATGTYSAVAVVLPGTTSYLDAGLSPALTYYYQVRALNFGADSPFSNEVSLTTPVPPQTPSGAHTTRITTNEIDFAWTNNATDGTITRVLRNSSAGGNFIFIAALPPSATTYSDLGPGGQGLTPGTKYDYHIQVGNVAGYSDFTGFTVQTLTNAPGLPTAIGADGQVTLTWTVPNGAASFNVYRSTAPGAEGAVPIANGIAGNSFLDTGLTNGQTYFYELTAVDSGGESAASAEASATPLAPLATSSPPGNLSATAGDTRATLNWIAAPGATSYNVYQGTASGGEALLQSGVTGTTLVQSGLANGQTYYYQVTSVNALGEGSRSAEVSVTPHTQAPPTPINVTAVATDGQVSLSWTAASDAASYNVYRSTDQGDEVLYQQGVAGTSLVDTHVADGTTYFYQISAANGVGESNLSLEVSATPLPPLPAAPTALIVSGINATQISLQWQGGPVLGTGFEILRSSDDVNFTPLTTLDSGVASYVDSSSLVPGTTYYYQVVATNLAGNSAPSNTAQAAVLAQLPPPWADADIGSPPLAGSAYFSNNALTVSGNGNDIWNASDQFNFAYQAFNGDGSIIARVTSQGNSDPWAKAGLMIRNTLDASSAFAGMFLTPGNGAALQWRQTAAGTPGYTGLANYAAPNWVELTRSGATFTGYVSTDDINWTQVGSITISMNAQVYVGLAVTSHNIGAISTSTFNNITINNTTGQPPAVPGIQSPQAVSGTSAIVSWSDTDTSLYGYQVYRQDPGTANFSLIAALPANVTSFSDTGLTPGATYSYQIVASNTVGNSAPSSAAAVTLPVPPVAPSLLQFNQISTASTGLNWRLNSGDDTAVNVYRRDGNAGSFTLVKTLPAGTQAYIDSTLQAGSLYEYRVTAVNAAGESGFADAGVTTLPAAPTSVAATAADSEVTLNWTASAGALAYNVYRGLSSGGEGATPYASGIAIPTFADIGVNDGTKYYYFITAVDFSGEGASSSEASGLPQAAPQLAAAPTALAYLAPGPAVAVDPNITVLNPAQIAMVTGGTVSISAGFVAGEDHLTVGIANPNIMAVYDPSTGVLTLTGNDTAADYQALLRSVSYQDMAANPTLASRSITFQISDATGAGAATRSVVPTADQPAVLQTTPSTLNYMPLSGAQLVDPNVTISDTTAPMLASASVSIGSYTSGDGILAFTPAAGIAGSYDPVHGVLTLTGTASVVAYQQALQSVTLDSSNPTPLTVTKTISFTVSDGFVSSNAAGRDVLINPDPWQNPVLRWDVNNDGVISPIDALDIINRLNSVGAGSLTIPAPEPPPEFYDVTGDDLVTPLDALNVINYINAALGHPAVATPAAIISSIGPPSSSSPAVAVAPVAGSGVSAVAFSVSTGVASPSLSMPPTAATLAPAMAANLNAKAVADFFEALGSAVSEGLPRRNARAAPGPSWDDEL